MNLPGFFPYGDGTPPRFRRRNNGGVFESCRDRSSSVSRDHTSKTLCAPARIRTWNNCFEGSRDIHFTTRAYGYYTMIDREIKEIAVLCMEECAGGGKYVRGKIRCSFLRQNIVKNSQCVDCEGRILVCGSSFRESVTSF